MSGKRRRRAPSEARLDLENIRHLKRLTKRVVKRLEEMERFILKMERGAAKRQGVPTAEELEATREFYGAPEDEAE